MKDSEIELEVQEETKTKKETRVPISQKLNLTIKEAAAYSNIGENTLRELISKDSTLPFIIYVRSKKLIKRKEFEEWNSCQYIVK